MPYVRFLAGAGGALVALMFAANAYLPAATTDTAQQQDIDRSTIRIKSTKKGPERVVIDTSLPTVMPAAPAPITIASVAAQAASPKDGVHEAFARASSEDLVHEKPVAKPAVKEASRSQSEPHRKRKAVVAHRARERPPVYAYSYAPQPRRQFADMFSPWWVR